jgi:hypothetical protein
MPRPKLSPADRVAKVLADLDTVAYAAEQAKRAIASGDQAKLAEAAKHLEAVGCYARRTDLPQS